MIGFFYFDKIIFLQIIENDISSQFVSFCIPMSISGDI